MTIFSLLPGLACLLLLASLAALLRVPHGAIRSLDFPRLQIAGLAALCLALAPFLPGRGQMALTLAAAGATLAIQATRILRYTPLWRRQSHRPKVGRAEDRVSILAANVKLSNRDFDRLIAVARKTDPDVLIVVETDAPWLEALEVLHDTYPHRLSRPLDTGYGLALYSKLAMQDPEIRELLVEGVPSIRVALKLASGRRFRLYVVHPEPPVPSLDSVGRDAEIGLVGIEAAKDPLPAVVAGDLNDVAWSPTTRRFQRLSQLLDPRVGRGFYNTFDARYPLLRWPLDHLFHDPRFRLVTMRRLPDIGSDHFPMLFCLQLEPGTPAEAPGDTPAPASAEDHAEIREMARTEAARDREAIGSDWEDTGEDAGKEAR